MTIVKMLPLKSLFGALVVVVALFGNLQAAEPLPDTGQTKFYDNTGRMISEPAPGDAVYGQDANYTRDRSYTKLDQNGNVLSLSATTWYQVRDNVTGLIWEVKTNDGSIHDRDNEYTWSNAQSVFIADLNFGSGYCGHSDWRLPTIKELSRLTDSSRHSPAINIAYFPQALSRCCYWSSTTYASSTYDAWLVNFGDGNLRDDSKSDSNYVRAVRSGQPQSLEPLVDNGDGTITDPNTGLMWQQSEPGTMSWQNALAYCEKLVLPVGSYNDWRLPDRHELQSLVDYSRYNPCLDKTFFHGVLSRCRYWSSTTYAGSTNYAWHVYFGDGYVAINDTKAYNYYVRAVRAGQSGALDPLIMSFTATPISGVEPLTVTFSCSADDPDGGGIAQYRWDFDNNGIDDQNTDAGSVTHTFSVAGTYYANCTAVDDEGATVKSNTVVISVSAIVDPNDVDNDSDGYTVTQGDCDDNDPLIHPGAPEICGDGIDNNCNGMVDEDCSVPVPSSYHIGPYNYYLPYFIAGNYWTGLGLANHNHAISDKLLVTVYDSNGYSKAREIKTIPAYGQDAFAVAPQLNTSGWVEINTHQAMYGSAFIGSATVPLLMADIPFISDLSTCLVVPHIAQDANWDTTILICNPNSEHTSASLKYVDKTGVVQGIKNYNILPHGSGVYLLSEVFSEKIPLAGRIEINSSAGIAAFALYTDKKSGGTYYAGINADSCE